MTVSTSQRQSDAVYWQLRGEIIDWKLSPGEALSEIELAERFAVSRTPLREAIQRLSREGLITTQHGRGAMVSELSISEIVSLVQWRQAIEPYAVRLCASTGNLDVFTAIETELTASQALLDADRSEGAQHAYFDLIARFDDAIARECSNRHLASSLVELHGHLYRIRRLARRSHARLRATTKEHLDICRAICDRDERAAVEATTVHIENSFQSVLNSISQQLVPSDRLTDEIVLMPQLGGPNV